MPREIVTAEMAAIAVSIAVSASGPPALTHTNQPFHHRRLQEGLFIAKVTFGPFLVWLTYLCIEKAEFIQL